jgi:hypothetical protein
MTILLVQRGGHNVEHELIFPNHGGYIFHDSRGFEAGSAEEVDIVKDFIRRRSQERRWEKRLHAIWFVPFDICNCKFTRFVFQVLRSDGQ